MTEPQSDIESELIPVEYVQTGYSLAIDRGQGPQLFQVQAIRFQSTRQDDGSHINRYTLTSEAPADGGDPWVLELPAGSTVVALYRRGRRPATFPPRG